MAAKVLNTTMKPGTVQIAKVSFGIASDNPDVAFSAIASDVEAKTLFKVPFGTFVTNVIVNVRTAFGSTGSPTWTIGDTDADGYLPSSDLIASDAGIKSMLGKDGSTGGAFAAAYHSGRLYGSDDTYDTDNLVAIQATQGTTFINAGLADVYLVFFNVNEA